MSAGQNLRRGYAYGLGSTLDAAPTTRRSGPVDLVAAFAIVALVLVVAAMATDQVLTASVGRTLGTAWSEAIAFLLRVVSAAV